MAAVALTAVAAWPAPDSVAVLVREIRAAIEARQPDADVWLAIQRAPLTERLEDAAIEELESAGAGPLAIEELERRRDLTRAMPAAAPIVWADAPPAPSAAEQVEILARARTIAAHYLAGLPNFMCSEEVRRYAFGKQHEWRELDTVTWEAGFSGRQERLRLVAVNGHPVEKGTVGGTTSTGEFGVMIAALFDPQSKARFAWARWTRLRGRPAHVFSVAMDREHAAYSMNAGGRLIHHHATVAMRGEVFLDRETGQVLRVSYDADQVPERFPIREAHTVVDYDWAEIGGQKYLLPHRSNMRMVDTHELTRNVTEFTKYRKFTSDAEITFGQPKDL